MRKYDRMLNFRYFLLQALFWGAAVINYAYMTQVLESKGFTAIEIGILNGAKLLIGIAFQVWIGVFADKHVYTVPLKKIIAILAITAAILTVGLYLVGHNFVVMLVISLGFGVTFTTISPLIDSLSMLYVNHGEHVNYAKGRIGGSVSWAILCLGAGWYCDSFGLRTFTIWGIVFLIILGIAAITMPWSKIEKNNFRSKGKSVAHQQPHSVLYILKNYPVYTVFLLGCGVMFMGYNFGTTFLIDVFTGLGGNNTDFGMAHFVLAISEVPSVFILLRLKDKIPIKWMMLCCAIFMTLKNLIPSYATSIPLVIGAQLCEMLGFGLFYAGSMYFISELLPEADIVKGATLLSVATVGIGEGIAAMLSGVIRHQIGLYGLLKIATITNAAAILIILIMCNLKEEKRYCIDSSMIP